MSRRWSPSRASRALTPSPVSHPDLDPGDLPALRDLVRFGVMADDQLARRYADPASSATRLLHLKEAGFVDVWWERLEGARVYSPTRLARLIAAVPSVRPRRTYPAHLAHDVAVVDLADALVARDPSLRWIAEDEVRDFLDQIAPPPLRMPGDPRHRPDGLVVSRDARIGIELEHTEKHQPRYARISTWFIREVRIHRVRWYIDDPRILERLRQVNRDHGFDRDMQIELEPFPPGVRVRQRAGRFEP